MKKFFIGLFVGLIALFGITSTSVGSQYFLENTQIKKQFVNNPDCNILELSYIYVGGSNFLPLNLNGFYTIYLINNELPNNTYLAKYENVNSIGFTENDIELEINDGENYINISTNTQDNNYRFYTYNNLKVDKILFNEIFDLDTAIDGAFNTEQDRDYTFENLGITNNLDTELVLPTIEYNSSEEPDTPEEPTPPPDIGSMESSIGNVIRGIIEWFVDIFNGLADAFVVVNESGQFIGFTVWGQVLFIEVAIGLVMIVLRWVISLIRGI